MTPKVYWAFVMVLKRQCTVLVCGTYYIPDTLIKAVYTFDVH